MGLTDSLYKNQVRLLRDRLIGRFSNFSDSEADVTFIILLNFIISPRTHLFHGQTKCYRKSRSAESIDFDVHCHT